MRKPNRFFDGDRGKNAMATTYFEHVLWCPVWNPSRDRSAGEGGGKTVCGEAGVLGVGSGVHTGCNIGVVTGTVYGHRCHFSS